EAGGPTAGVEALGLEPGEDPQGLGIALEAADVSRERIEGRLGVVPEGWVTQVMSEAGGVDDVGAAAERGAELPSDLSHLERVGESVADEVIAARLEHLGLRRQAPQ